MKLANLSIFAIAVAVTVGAGATPALAGNMIGAGYSLGVPYTMAADPSDRNKLGDLGHSLSIVVNPLAHLGVNIQAGTNFPKTQFFGDSLEKAPQEKKDALPISVGLGVRGYLNDSDGPFAELGGRYDMASYTASSVAYSSNSTSVGGSLGYAFNFPFGMGVEASVGASKVMAMSTSSGGNPVSVPGDALAKQMGIQVGGGIAVRYFFM